jgi:hypothetical protein
LIVATHEKYLQVLIDIVVGKDEIMSLILNTNKTEVVITSWKNINGDLFRMLLNLPFSECLLFTLGAGWGVVYNKYETDKGT